MILSKLLQTWRKITIKAEWQFYGVEQEVVQKEGGTQK